MGVVHATATLPSAGAAVIRLEVDVPYDHRLMALCASCSLPLPEGARFCPSCGHEVLVIAAEERRVVTVLFADIEDHPDNTTRFLVIGRQSYPPSGQDKTSLLLSTPNRPGALHDMLSPIASNDVSMTRIESRPSRRAAWDYVFFVDVEGHQDDL